MCKCAGYVSVRIPNPNYEGNSGEGVDRWGNYEYMYEEEYQSYEEDIDPHRFKCTMCGEIGYRSKKAKEHFEGEADHSDILFLKKSK